MDDYYGRRDKLEAALGTLMKAFTQVPTDGESGGIHTAPELRLFLLALAKLIGATDILETGYDSGMTVEAIDLSGARVTGVDDRSEYPGVKPEATRRLVDYPDVRLIEKEACQYLREQADASFDLVFVDDNHAVGHVKEEAEHIHRVLRPGGIVVFHDSSFRELYGALKEVLIGWEHIQLPTFSPVLKQNMGVAVFKKPEI